MLWLVLLCDYFREMCSSLQTTTSFIFISSSPQVPAQERKGSSNHNIRHIALLYSLHLHSAACRGRNCTSCEEWRCASLFYCDG